MKTREKDGYTLVKNKGAEYFTVAPGVWGIKIAFVNVYIVSASGGAGNNWVLIDAGLRGSARKIRRVAEELFGRGTRPAAILLTHGHFDHVGALEELLDMWNVPVYAHYLELPYLKGLSAYPPPDPMVGGGLMSLLSWMFPKSPKDLGKRVHRLGTDGSVPVLTDWNFIHTPGHAPGQVAFFRESDRTLIAADTFVTVKQESAFAVMTQARRLSGPPKYFTIDWKAAKESVSKLADLNPAVAATGHGYPMAGEELSTSLSALVDHFDQVAVPDYGRYVKEPARANKNGVQYIPKKTLNPVVITGAGLFAAAATFGLIWGLRRRYTSSK